MLWRRKGLEHSLICATSAPNRASLDQPVHPRELRVDPFVRQAVVLGDRPELLGVKPAAVHWFEGSTDDWVFYSGPEGGESDP